MVKKFNKKSSAKKWAKRTPGSQRIWKAKKGWKAKTVKKKRR